MTDKSASHFEVILTDQATEKTKLVDGKSSIFANRFNGTSAFMQNGDEDELEDKNADSDDADTNKNDSNGKSGHTSDDNADDNKAYESKTRSNDNSEDDKSDRDTSPKKDKEKEPAITAQRTLYDVDNLELKEEKKIFIARQTEWSRRYPNTQTQTTESSSSLSSEQKNRRDQRSLEKKAQKIEQECKKAVELITLAKQDFAMHIQEFTCALKDNDLERVNACRAIIENEENLKLALNNLVSPAAFPRSASSINLFSLSPTNTGKNRSPTSSSSRSMMNDRGRSRNNLSPSDSPTESPMSKRSPSGNQLSSLTRSPSAASRGAMQSPLSVLTTTLGHYSASESSFVEKAWINNLTGGDGEIQGQIKLPKWAASNTVAIELLRGDAMGNCRATIHEAFTEISKIYKDRGLDRPAEVPSDEQYYALAVQIPAELKCIQLALEEVERLFIAEIEKNTSPSKILREQLQKFCNDKETFFNSCVNKFYETFVDLDNVENFHEIVPLVFDAVEKKIINYFKKREQVTEQPSIPKEIESQIEKLIVKLQLNPYVARYLAAKISRNQLLTLLKASKKLQSAISRATHFDTSRMLAINSIKAFIHKHNSSAKLEQTEGQFTKRIEEFNTHIDHLLKETNNILAAQKQNFRIKFSANGNFTIDEGTLNPSKQLFSAEKTLAAQLIACFEVAKNGKNDTYEVIAAGQDSAMQQAMHITYERLRVSYKNWIGQVVPVATTPDTSTPAAPASSTTSSTTSSSTLTVEIIPPKKPGQLIKELMKRNASSPLSSSPTSSSSRSSASPTASIATLPRSSSTSYLPTTAMSSLPSSPSSRHVQPSRSSSPDTATNSNTFARTQNSMHQQLLSALTSMSIPADRMNDYFRDACAKLVDVHQKGFMPSVMKHANILAQLWLACDSRLKTQNLWGAHYKKQWATTIADSLKDHTILQHKVVETFCSLCNTDPNMQASGYITHMNLWNPNRASGAFTFDTIHEPLKLLAARPNWECGDTSAYRNGVGLKPAEIEPETKTAYQAEAGHEVEKTWENLNQMLIH